MSPNGNQPQQASGTARVSVEGDPWMRTVRIELERGDEIGFAIGALNAVGFDVTAARPGVVAVLLGDRRLTSVVRALRAVGFTVREGDDR